jgi:hypothetical protein
LFSGAVENEKKKGGGLRPRLAVGLVDLPIDQHGDLEKHAIEASLQHFADGLFIWGARRIGRVVDEDPDSVV